MLLKFKDIQNVEQRQQKKKQNKTKTKTKKTLAL